MELTVRESPTRHSTDTVPTKCIFRMLKYLQCIGWFVVYMGLLFVYMGLLFFVVLLFYVHGLQTSKVMSGRSVNLTTLFLGRLRPPKRLTSTLCTYSYFRQ